MFTILTAAIVSVHVWAEDIELNWFRQCGNLGTSTITVGDTVTWIWTDTLSHTVTSTDNFESDTLKGPATWSYQFHNPGMFSYFCAPHPSMEGIIWVQPSESSNPTSNPTKIATASPSQNPSDSPTNYATDLPTQSQSQSNDPTLNPSKNPTQLPTFSPTSAPTNNPTLNPTFIPTETRTFAPSLAQTLEPTSSPSQKPSQSPSSSPSHVPSQKPTELPTQAPSNDPTQSPSQQLESATDNPTQTPSLAPLFASTSNYPTQILIPTQIQKTENPTQSPTNLNNPTVNPTAIITSAQNPTSATLEGSANGQSATWTFTVDANNNNDAHVVIDVEGPDDRWFCIGINATSMQDSPYTICVFPDGSFNERKLDILVDGTIFYGSSLVRNSRAVSGGVQTLQLQRELAASSNVADYTFSTSLSIVNVIYAFGADSSRSVTDISYHGPDNRVNGERLSFSELPPIEPGSIQLSELQTQVSSNEPTKTPTGNQTLAPSFTPSNAPKLPLSFVIATVVCVIFHFLI